MAFSSFFGSRVRSTGLRQIGDDCEKRILGDVAQRYFTSLSRAQTAQVDEAARAFAAAFVLTTRGASTTAAQLLSGDRSRLLGYLQEAMADRLTDLSENDLADVLTLADPSDGLVSWTAGASEILGLLEPVSPRPISAADATRSMRTCLGVTEPAIEPATQPDLIATPIYRYNQPLPVATRTPATTERAPAPPAAAAEETNYTPYIAGAALLVIAAVVLSGRSSKPAPAKTEIVA